MIRRRKQLANWQPRDKQFQHLPVFKICWPSTTWMRARLAYVRQQELQAAVQEAGEARREGRMQ